MLDSQVNFIDSLRDVYENTISTKKFPLYGTYVKLSQFTLCNRNTADIVKAIEILQPTQCNQLKHVIEPAKGIHESYNGANDINAHYFSETKGQILLKHRDFMIEINDVFFDLKLRQYVEFKFDCIEKYDYVSSVSDYNDFVAICVQSTMAFRHFYKVTARQAIQHNFPPIMLQYLDHFVHDVKLRRMSVEDFYRMYDDDLYNYVKIVSEISGNRGSSEYDIVVNMLENLRAKSYYRLVVVVTHFQKFAHLLKIT